MPSHETTPDSTYAPVLLTIESIIHFMDEAAVREGVVWTDGQILGILHKVIAQARGRGVDLDLGDNLRDQLLVMLYERLVQTPMTVFEEIRQLDGSIRRRPLRKAVWVASLNTIVHAAGLRRSPFPESRQYLDYLKRFLTRIQNGE